MKPVEFISNWGRGILSETKAITWPTRHRVYVDTMIVLAALVVGGVIIGFLDYGLLSLFKLAISKVG